MDNRPSQVWLDSSIGKDSPRKVDGFMERHTQRSQDRRIEALFGELVDLPEEKREQKLRSQAAAESEVVEAVRRLFASMRGTPDSFLQGDTIDRLGSAQTPTSIGGYRVLRKIGEGGMGTVYEAEQVSPRRRVALKVIRSELATPTLLQRFEREAEILGQLQHSGIAHVYESGDAGSEGRPWPYFAMEFIDGPSLKEYARQSQLSVQQKLDLVARVADAVQHAHQKGILHRDLKPANILVVDGREGDVSTTIHSTTGLAGRPKVLDFGIARVLDADSVQTLQTQTGQILGTLAYMSPEQIVGDSAHVDARCDIYTLGIILYELLADRSPLDLSGLSIVEAARVLEEQEPTSLGSLDRSLRGDVSTIVSKALEKNPERRYRSASEFAADIRRYLNDEPIAARPASTVYQWHKFARRNRALVGGVATTLLVLFLGLISTGYYLFESEKSLAALEAKRREIERHLYGTRMRLAAHVVNKVGSLDGVRELVALTEAPTLDAVRGWEWYFLLAECEREVAVLAVESSAHSVRWRPRHDAFVIADKDEIRCYDGRSRTLQWVVPSLGPRSVVNWDADGRRLAVASGRSEVWILNGNDGTILEKFASPDQQAFYADWSPDGRTLAIGNPRSLSLWVDSKKTRTLPLEVNGRQFDWSPDGQRIAYCDTGGSRAGFVLDLASEESRRFSTGYGLETVSWRPDGGALAYLTNGGKGGLVDPKTLEPLREFAGLRGYDLAMGWKPDSTRLAVAGPPGVVLVYDSAGKVTARFSGHDGGVNDLHWHPSEPRLLSLGKDGTTRLWDSQSGSRFLPTPLGDWPTMALAWSADGSELATAQTAGGVQLWNASTQASTGLLERNSMLYSDVDWSPCGRFISTVESGGVVRLWDAESRRPLFPIEHSGQTTQLAWGPEGRRVALMGAGYLSLWDVEQRICLEVFEPETKAWAPLTGSPFEWRPGFEEVTYIDGEHRLVVVPISSPSLGRAIVTPDRGVVDLDWSPDGRSIVTAAESGGVRVWDMSAPTSSQALSGHTRWPTGVSWSPDGRRIASAGEDHTIRLWDAEDGTPLAEFAAHEAPLRDLCWSPCGTLLASADSKGDTRVWNAIRGYQKAGVSPLPVGPTSSSSTDATSPFSASWGRDYVRARRYELAGERDQANEAWSRLEAQLTGSALSESERERIGRHYHRNRAYDASCDRWQVVQPIAERATRALVRRQGDASHLFAQPNPDGAVYTIEVRSRHTSVSGLRLEALPDPRLPSGGPGWHATGGFHVASLTASRVGFGSEVSTPLEFSRIVAENSSLPESRHEAVQDWVADSGQRSVLYLLLVDPIENAPSQILTIRIECGSGRALARLRLSTCQELDGVDREAARLEALRAPRAR